MCTTQSWGVKWRFGDFRVGARTGGLGRIFICQTFSRSAMWESHFVREMAKFCEKIYLIGKLNIYNNLRDWNFMFSLFSRRYSSILAQATGLSEWCSVVAVVGPTDSRKSQLEEVQQVRYWRLPSSFFESWPFLGMFTKICLQSSKMINATFAAGSFELVIWICC